MAYLMVYFATSVHGYSPVAVDFSYGIRPQRIRSSVGMPPGVLKVSKPLRAAPDAGQTWNKLNVPGTAYYPRSVQAKDGRIFVCGHVGGDNAYGTVD